MLAPGKMTRYVLPATGASSSSARCRVVLRQGDEREGNGFRDGNPQRHEEPVKARRLVVVVGIGNGSGEEPAPLVGAKTDAHRSPGQPRHHRRQPVPLLRVDDHVIPSADGRQKFPGFVVVEDAVNGGADAEDGGIARFREDGDGCQGESAA